ncbi:MAG: tRNA pseudouridine(38-40) synthase TruA, partial [Gammaproteobacteria bacterium]
MSFDPLVRIACGVEYNGAAYRGWQDQKSQPDTVTVQQSVEKALSFVANEPVEIVCAGRTDCEVHATAQAIHFDTRVSRSTDSWLLGGNANLPADIRLQWVKVVAEEFHARFSAVSRAYRYVIDNSPRQSAILQSRVSWHRRPLDEKAMGLGAHSLLGEHDFSSFRAKACQANRPIRTITQLDIHRSGRFIYIDIAANAFLYHMVRNIVG